MFVCANIQQIHMFVCVCLCIYAYICMRVCKYICMYVYVHVFDVEVLFFVFFVHSQKDLENLKSEVQRRQQLQELGKSKESTEERPLELEDKIPVD